MRSNRGMQPSELMIHDGMAYHIGARAEDIAPQMLLVGDPARARLVAERFDHVRVTRKHREYVTITGSYRGLPVSVMGTGMGTDNVEIGLIEAWSLLSFDAESKTRHEDAPDLTVIRVGTSGGVQADIDAGTIAVSTWGLGLDTTGIYYQHVPEDPRVLIIEQAARQLLRDATPKDYRFRDAIWPYCAPACPEVAAALTAGATRRGLGTVSGITAATPGFYGASGRYLDGLQNTVPGIKGCLAQLECDGLRVVNMEMESSLLFHLGDALGLRTGTICPVISNPSRQTSIVDYAPYVSSCIDIALDAMVALCSVEDSDP
ncbi:MAG: uridine phosphorylase [Myxococcota bacterium]|jgi:uridine phosphorylase